jgi:hypothetical protein
MVGCEHSLYGIDIIDIGAFDFTNVELKFMQENREKLRMGIPVAPLVPHSKLQELLQKVIPTAVQAQLEINKTKTGEHPLPSKHTIQQLLQSFSGYHSWTAAAAKEGSVNKLTKDLKDEKEPVAHARLLFKRGRRHVTLKVLGMKWHGCWSGWEWYAIGLIISMLLPSATNVAVIWHL